jgi:hypothetical protein
METAKAYCESESTCVSFEANPTTGRFQFSTSCTVSVAQAGPAGWSLFVIARKTPTASQRANLKLAHDNYVTNTKASFAAAEPLYKQAVVEFGAMFGGGSFLTKSAKKRYNNLLVHDSSKPAAEQAFSTVPLPEVYVQIGATGWCTNAAGGGKALRASSNLTAA